MSSLSIQPTPVNLRGGIDMPQRQGAHAKAREALSQALSSGDLEASRAAFATFSSLSKPDRATAHPDGAFATLQKALAAGDVSAAKTAFEQLGQHRGAVVPKTSHDLLTSTEPFGTLGQNLNLSA